MVLRIVHTVLHTLIALVWRIFHHIILTFRNRRRSLSVAAFRRSTVTVFFLHALHAHAKHGRFVIWTPLIWCEMGSRTCCSKWSTVDDDADDGNDCKCDASSSSLLPLDVDVAIGDKTAIVKKFVPQFSSVIVSWRFINPISFRRLQQITGHFLSLQIEFATCLIVTNWNRSFTKCNLFRLLWLLVIDLLRNLFLFDTTEMCTNFVIITHTLTDWSEKVFNCVFSRLVFHDVWLPRVNQGAHFPVVEIIVSESHPNHLTLYKNHLFYHYMYTNCFIFSTHEQHFSFEVSAILSTKICWFFSLVWYLNKNGSHGCPLIFFSLVLCDSLWLKNWFSTPPGYG